MNFIDLHYVIDFIVGVGVIGAAFAFLRSAVQKQSNTLLRALVEDQRKSIDDLKEWRATAEIKISSLEKQVSVLNGKNGDLSELVVKALGEYFTQHPDAAQYIGGLLSRPQNV